MFNMNMKKTGRKVAALLTMALLMFALSFTGCSHGSELETYEVTFESNGGSSVQAQTVVEDSLVVCEDPYQDYFMLARFHREIVKDHITIAENTETDERENQYIVWVDTAWFRKNIIESRGGL